MKLPFAFKHSGIPSLEGLETLKSPISFHKSPKGCGENLAAFPGPRAGRRCIEAAPRPRGRLEWCVCDVEPSVWTPPHLIEDTALPRKADPEDSVLLPSSK